jgi:hypothetical protein
LSLIDAYRASLSALIKRNLRAASAWQCVKRSEFFVGCCFVGFMVLGQLFVALLLLQL